MFVQKVRLFSAHIPPVLMAVRGALLLEIGEWGIRPTEYEELESVALWRSFLQAPEQFMRHF